MVETPEEAIARINAQISENQRRQQEIKNQIDLSRGDVSGLQNELVNLNFRLPQLQAELRGWREGGEEAAAYYSTYEAQRQQAIEQAQAARAIEKAEEAEALAHQKTITITDIPAKKIALKWKDRQVITEPSSVIYTYQGAPGIYSGRGTSIGVQKVYSAEDIPSFPSFAWSATKAGLEAAGTTIFYPTKLWQEKREAIGKEELQRGIWMETEKYPTKGKKGTAEISVLPYSEEMAIKQWPEAAGEYLAKIKERELQNQVDNQVYNIVKDKTPEYTAEQTKIFNIYQARINKGENYEEIVKKFNKANEDLQKRFEEDVRKTAKPKIEGLTKEAEKYLEVVSKRTARYTILHSAFPLVATGAVLGFTGGVFPAIGKGIGIVGGLTLAKETPSIYADIKKGDLYSLGTKGIATGFVLAGGLVGGIAGAKYRSKYIEQPKITSAIKDARVKSTYKDLTTTKKLQELRISGEGERVLQEYLDKGYSIRLFETKLIAKSISAKKYLPGVRGRFIEVLSRNGKIIERINLGSIISKYKGKTFSQASISDAIGKLEGDTAKYYMRSFIAKETKAGTKLTQYYETLEQIKLKESQRAGIYQKLRGRAEVRMLKEVQKPKPSDITRTVKFGKLTELQAGEMIAGWAKAKPYGKADITYIGKMVKGEIKIQKQNLPEWADYSSYLIGGKKIEYGRGLSIFERVTAEIKLSKKMKAWDIGKPVKVKPIKYISPKPVKFVPEFPEPLRMEAYTKAFIKPDQAPSSIPSFLTYETAYGLVPDFAKAGRINNILIPLVGTVTAGQLLKVSTREIQQLKLQQVQLQKLEKLQQLKVQQIQIQKISSIQLQQQKLQLKLQQVQLQKLAQLNIPQITPHIPRPSFPKLKIPIIPPPFKFPRFQEGLDKKRKLDYEKQMKKQRRAYQASVGAVSLGLVISKKQAKKLQKKFTGGEIRPMIRGEYNKKLNKLLIGR